jgi:hypothetical protein
MGTKSRETIYGASVRASAERAAEARKEADRLACKAWNQRMLGFQGPAQPSPALDGGDLGRRLYREVKKVGRASSAGLFHANRKSCDVSAAWLCTTTSLPGLNVIVLS